MARQSIQKLSVLQKVVKAFSKKIPYILRPRPDLLCDLFPPIKHGNNVFQIMTGHEIALAASEKSFKLGGKKERGCNKPNNHTAADLGPDRMMQSRQVPSVAKAKNMLICRHDVHPYAVNEPAAERSPFA